MCWTPRTRLVWAHSSRRRSRCRWSRSGCGRPQPLLSPRELVLVAGGGMRGAVSVAAVLSIPVSVGGKAFPDRGTLLFIAFGAVLLTLVLPALGMRPLIGRLGLASGDEPD